MNFFFTLFSRAVVLCAVLGSEQGLACAVFTAPITYQKANAIIDFDGSPQAQTVRLLAYQQYADTLAAAVSMEARIAEFLDKPTLANQRQAQAAWQHAKRLYQQTEWTRFTESPIDWAAIGARPAGPETRLNAWPLNEAVIDYVKGAPHAGLIQRLDLPISSATILAADQFADEADVTTGWHAIEFLLWGQDFSLSQAGQRPVSDFQLSKEPKKDPVVQRRREYLRLVTSMLVTDLTTVKAEWDPNDLQSYSHQLSAMPAIEQIGRAMHGATTLLVTELAGQRLTTALDSGSAEDEHSCFSDFTLQDLQANLAGVRAVYESGAEASLMALIQWRDPALHQRLQSQFEAASLALHNIPEPFDAVLAAKPTSAARQQAEQAAAELQKLGVLLKNTAEVLSIDIVVPGV